MGNEIKKSGETSRTQIDAFLAKVNSLDRAPQQRDVAD
jgi:hypothetical protein